MVFYAYLDVHPERGELVFSRVFDGIIDEADMPNGDLTDEESELVKRLKGTMDRVSGIMAADEGKAYSVDEASRLVNDPFPAPVLVKLDGEILELEGFVRDPEAGGVRTKTIGLWDSLSGLRGRWLTPDPLMTNFEYARAREDKKPFSLGAFVALPRRATAPKDWREVRSAIDEGLKQTAVYRVRWVKRR